MMSMSSPARRSSGGPRLIRHSGRNGEPCGMADTAQIMAWLKRPGWLMITRTGP
jgi:hypothetical protein